MTNLILRPWATIALAFLSAFSPCHADDVAGRAYSLPVAVSGVEHPVLSLDGTWKFHYKPRGRTARIQVPGEAAMQGFAVRHDTAVVYSRTFRVPADFAGHRAILRFDGVYCQARLSVNGHFVREHYGGFTRWETDVTQWLRPGKKNEVRLEVTDRLDDISYASGYAHHPIGGILRGVTLFALPESHVYDCYVETDLDTLYRDATLRVGFQYAGRQGGEATLRLTDPEGRAVSLPDSRFALRPGTNDLRIPVAAPQKWDAEHPRLYTLTLTLKQDGKDAVTLRRQVGFREIEIRGDRMLVNGRQVKLRGACRHDVSPTMGRSTTAELDSLDALLFKESNMNFVRTSHYPPSEKFLEYCDRYGIYVECETAVCFVDTYRQKNYAPGRSQDDSAYADRYLGQCQEMVKSFRSHPSVLFWSIGNESIYGENLRRCNTWVRATDRTRPVIFSYPGSVPDEEHVYDILSMHYPGVDGNLWQYNKHTENFQGEGIPALFDEWAHPACYTYTTLQTDPNIREFWGQSLDMMWSRLYDAPGGLGGAIWGYVDDTFMLPVPRVGTAYWKEFAHTAKPDGFRGNCVGYGEWGIVDVWRRKKPEFWATKKAYSPVRLETSDVVSFTPGQPLRFTVRNRYDHTLFTELTAHATYRGHRTPLVLPAIGPHEKGILTVPAAAWTAGDTLRIDFRDDAGRLVDTYLVWLGQRVLSPVPALDGDELRTQDDDKLITIIGSGFTVSFDKRTGLIAGVRAGEQSLISGGPYLNAYINLNHLSGAEVRKMADHYAVRPDDWKLTVFEINVDADEAKVRTTGTYGPVRVQFDMSVNPTGRLSISYVADGLPNGYLREEGIALDLDTVYRSLSWQRDGYWSCYPDDALSGNEGNVPLVEREAAAYGAKPSGTWALDGRDYYYWSDAGANCGQSLTRAAKSMKENVYRYTLSTAETSGAGYGLTVQSAAGDVACRTYKESDGRLTLYVNNRWDYPEIAWGNYCKRLEALPCYGRVDLQLRRPAQR